MTWLTAIVLSCVAASALAKRANLVLLEDAVKDGAVCLDGSPPGYYYRKGSGNWSESWIVHFEGGGWCATKSDCVSRSTTDLGSSKNWPSSASFGGFLSDDPATNDLFSAWNMVFVGYCDGASFAGDFYQQVNWEGTTLYFRGARILRAVVKHLLQQGMQNAKRVIMTGCSAGGITVYTQLDNVRAMLPLSVDLVGMSDAGYFIDIPSVSGEMLMREASIQQFKMQNCSSGMNQKCLELYPTEEWKCFLPQYTFSSIETEVFVLNSVYDTWQLDNSLQLGCLPPNCTEKQMQEFQNFRTTFLSVAKAATKDGQLQGAWLDSCLEHCQTLTNRQWSWILVSGQSAYETFANYYFGRPGNSSVIDCAYPCNKCGQ